MNLLSVVLVSSVLSFTPPETHTEADAVGWALDALGKYPEERRPFIRFVYIPYWGDQEWIGVMDYAMNAACSQTRTLQFSDKHAGGWLLGYDLSQFASGEQLTYLVQTWDSLGVEDPYFHVSKVNTEGPPTVVLAPHLASKIATNVTNPENSQRVDVLVTQLTGSTGGIYRADFLIEQLLTSAKGKYPEFRQTGTSLKELLGKRGFFFEQSRDLSGEKGALLLASDITGKSRVILTTFGLASRQPLAITFDFKDARTRPDQQFIRNLITFDPFVDAKEALVPMQNGLWEGILADGKDAIQRVAPPDVVSDFTKPDGHTKELEMGMSCFLCHFNQDGYKTVRNDMDFLLHSDVDIIGTNEEIATISGRYGENLDDPDGILNRARRDFVKSVAIITTPHLKLAEGQSPVQRLGEKLKDIYHTYRYRLIDAERACLELGVREGNVAKLKELVPRSEGVEDVTIGLLRNGAKIKRDDFEAIYVEMARRSKK